LALIVAVFGAAYGLCFLLAAGIPAVGLRLFNLLPFDRRLWWTFADVVAYFSIRGVILNSYQYANMSDNRIAR